MKHSQSKNFFNIYSSSLIDEDCCNVDQKLLIDLESISGSIVHEIKNKISTYKMLSELLKEEYSKKYHKKFELIERELRQILYRGQKNRYSHMNWYNHMKFSALIEAIDLNTKDNSFKNKLIKLYELEYKRHIIKSSIENNFNSREWFDKKNDWTMSNDKKYNLSLK